MSRPISLCRPSLLAVGLVASLALAFARPAAQTQTQSQDESQLADLMGAMKSNLKTLAQSLAAPETHPQALAALREMQVISIAAKTMDPPLLAEYGSEKQAAERIAYQVEMARLLGTLAAMEIDLLEGRVEAVVSAVPGKLFKLRNAAHDRWQ